MCLQADVDCYSCTKPYESTESTSVQEVDESLHTEHTVIKNSVRRGTNRVFGKSNHVYCKKTLY